MVTLNKGHSIMVLAALWADVTTMKILQNACIDGLYMGGDMIKDYWECFDERDRSFIGKRASVEEERAPFQALLDNIIPCLDLPPPPPARILNVPGAFPSDAESDSDSDSSEHSHREGRIRGIRAR